MVTKHDDAEVNVSSSLFSPYLYYYAPLIASLILYYTGFSSLLTSGYNLESLLSLIIILLTPLFFVFIGRHKVTATCAIDFEVGRVVIMMTALSTIAYGIQIAVLGPPPMFLARNKIEYFVFGVSLFFYLAQFSGPLAIAWWRITGQRLYLFLFLWNLFMLISLMNKNPVVQCVSVSFVLYLCFAKKMVHHLLLKLLFFFSVTLVSMYCLFYFNPVFANYEGYFYLLQKDHGIRTIDDPIVSMIFMYIAMGWENFFHYIETPDTYTYGAMFFQPLVKLLKLDALLPDLGYQDLVIPTLKNPGLTVATGFFRMYSDFGFLSLFIYILTYFGIVNFFHNAVSRRATLSQLYFLAYFNIFLCFLFFDNYFFLTISAFGLIFFWLAVKISRFDFYLKFGRKKIRIR